MGNFNFDNKKKKPKIFRLTAKKFLLFDDYDDIELNFSPASRMHLFFSSLSQRIFQIFKFSICDARGKFKLQPRHVPPKHTRFFLFCSQNSYHWKKICNFFLFHLFLRNYIRFGEREIEKSKKKNQKTPIRCGHDEERKVTGVLSRSRFLPGLGLTFKSPYIYLSPYTTP